MSSHDAVAKWRKAIAVVAAVAAAWSAVLLAGAAWWGRDAADALARAGAVPWIATAALFVVNYLFRFARWHWMLRAEGHAVPVPRSLAVFMAGLALLPTPGKAGVAVRSLLLQRDGVPVNVSLAVHFTERLTDLVGLLALAALLAGNATEVATWAGSLAAALATLLAIRLAPHACAMLRARVRAPRLQRGLGWLQQFIDHAAELASGWRIVPYVLLGLAANIALAALLWIVLHSLGVAISPLQAAGVLAVAHLTGSLSLLPGGLGGFELAMLAQLHLIGVAAGAALAATALVRVATIWAGVAVGVPLLLAALRSAQLDAGSSVTERSSTPSERVSGE